MATIDPQTISIKFAIQPPTRANKGDLFVSPPVIVPIRSEIDIPEERLLYFRAKVCVLRKDGEFVHAFEWGKRNEIEFIDEIKPIPLPAWPETSLFNRHHKIFFYFPDLFIDAEPGDYKIQMTLKDTHPSFDGTDVPATWTIESEIVTVGAEPVEEARCKITITFLVTSRS